MSAHPVDTVALEAALGLAGLRYWLGLEPALDVPELLRQHGVEEPRRLIEDAEGAPALRALAAIAPHLVRATQALGALHLEGRAGPLDAAALLDEMEGTSSASHLEAMARALHDGRVSALREPLAGARAALGGLAGAATTAPEDRLGGAEATELARALGSGRERPTRLARALQGRSPLPVEAWRGELRPLLEGLLAPAGASLGVSLHHSARGVPVLAARHPGRSGRWVLHLRPSSCRGVARAVALRCGEVVARVLGWPPALGGALVAAQLGAASLWRGAGLGGSAARDLARAHRRDLLRWALRLHAYAGAGDEDPRAWAAAAAARLGERDDVFGALCWQGPLPDPLGFPARRDGAALAATVRDLLRGVQAQQRLVEQAGDDWHRAPEAAETALEALQAGSADGDAATLWRLLED